MRRTNLVLSAIILIGICGGCGSGGSDDAADVTDSASGDDSGSASQNNVTLIALAKSEAVSAVSGALFIAGNSASRSESSGGDVGADTGAGGDVGADAPRGSDRAARVVSQTLSCPEGGSALVAGDLQLNGTSVPKTFSFAASAALANCNGNSGNVTVEVRGTAGERVVDFTASVAGSVTGSCVVDIPGVSEEANITAVGANASTDEQTITVNGTLTGVASADCNGQSVKCAWNGVDILDRAALEAGCSVGPQS